MPTGGTVGQILRKKSSLDYDTEWISPTSAGNIISKTGSGVLGLVGTGVSEVGGVSAPISYSLLTNNQSASDSSSYNIAAVNIEVNKLLVVVINNTADATAGVPTVSSPNLTFAQQKTFIYRTDTARLTIIRAMPASALTAESLSITFGATQVDCSWGVIQFANTDLSGTNGSGAFVGVGGEGLDPDAPPYPSVTMPAFGSANNATFAIVGLGNRAVTPGTGFTEVFEGAIVGDQRTKLFAQFANDNRTPAEATFPADGTWGMVGVELKRN